MNKFFKRISVFVVIILITACGTNKELLDNENEVIADSYIVEFDKIIKKLYENRAEINDSNFFQTNSIHATEPGGWGSGMGELYYYSDDGYYLWNISNYILDQREVAKAGTWKIENGRLQLNELYIMYRDGGKIVESDMFGESKRELIDYKVVIKKSDKIIDMKIENLGLSDYTKELGLETQDDTYILNNTDVWYSGVPADITYMSWIENYYNSNIKGK